MRVHCGRVRLLRTSAWSGTCCSSSARRSRLCLFGVPFYGISIWKSRSVIALRDLITVIQQCKLCCRVLASACSIATLRVTCVRSFFALLGGPDLLDSIRVVLVVSIVFFAAFVVAFLVLVGSVCVGLGVRDGGRRSPSSLSSLLLLRLLLFVLLLLLLGFNMCCSLW